jgi:hypothetical protein
MNSNSVLREFAIVATFAIMLTQYAGASGLGWFLYGNVTSASSCQPIIGAVVSSQYNNGAFNVTNSNGQFRLDLGTGNWSVTVSAANFVNGSYLTPYYTNGAWEHNFSLIPVGGTANSTPCSKNTTIINTTKTTVTPGLQNSSTVTVATTSTNQSGTTTYSGSNNNYLIGGIIVLVIIIIAAAYFMTRPKPTHHEHHETKE